MGVYEKPRPFGCTGECERCLDVTKCRGEFSVPKAPGNVTLENVARHLYYQYTRKRGWLEDKWDDEPEIVKNLYRNKAKGAIMGKKNPVVIYTDENGKQYRFTQFALVGVERVTDSDMELKTVVAITDSRPEIVKGIAQGVAACYESTRIAYHEAVKCRGEREVESALHAFSDHLEDVRRDVRDTSENCMRKAEQTRFGHIHPSHRHHGSRYP